MWIILWKTKIPLKEVAKLLHGIVFFSKKWKLTLILKKTKDWLTHNSWQKSKRHRLDWWICCWSFTLESFNVTRHMCLQLVGPTVSFFLCLFPLQISTNSYKPLWRSASNSVPFFNFPTPITGKFSPFISNPAFASASVTKISPFPDFLHLFW